MIAALVDKVWDVVVVGAGLAGGLAGRRLAESGASVLFLERGPLHARDAAQDGLTDVADPTARASRGYWPDRVHAAVDGRENTLFPPLGTGIGGTSLFYAAMLERPEPHELDEMPGVAHPTGGWPVGYAAFMPYFAAAEELLAVCGAPDPLAADPSSAPLRAPPFSAGDAAMTAELRRRGLHPYRKHVGVRYLPGCTECFGRMCPRDCKMDGRPAGVEPALRSGRAAIVDRCEVVALRGTAGRVDAVEARRDGATLRFRARRVVLAAGGLSSPRLLLASAAEHWPAGCGNGSGLVGRNLMFHVSERFAYWPRVRITTTPPFGAVSLRDFYRRDEVRFGHVHAMGLHADYGTILHLLRQRFDASRIAPVRPVRSLLRIPAFAAARVLGQAHIFVGLLEDMPLPQNRVILDPADAARIRFEYTVTPELRARRKAFRSLVRKGFGPARMLFLNHEPELNLAHCCGTLRFGHDPATSVLDADCRAHEVDNLHVADGSFMPTSNGINPSLTIAANALRVADSVAAALALGAPRRAEPCDRNQPLPG